jgi:hypothetical protein
MEVITLQLGLEEPQLLVWEMLNILVVMEDKEIPMELEAGVVPVPMVLDKLDIIVLLMVLVEPEMPVLEVLEEL